MEAYKPNEYGKSITIVRQIKKDGGSSYKLKSSSGINIYIIIESFVLC